MNSSLQCLSFKKLLLPFCLLACTIALYIPAFAQEQPPKPIEVAFTSESVKTAQNLSFGTFVHAVGNGTITVDINGNRVATGSTYVPASMSSTDIPSPAIFIVTALPGTLITIQGSANTLTCTGPPSGSTELTMFDSEPKSPFIVPPVKAFGDKYTEVVVKIGGKLALSSATTPGVYGGPFTVTFIQQ